jgi:hypothetical protein
MKRLVYSYSQRKLLVAQDWIKEISRFSELLVLARLRAD